MNNKILKIAASGLVSLSLITGAFAQQSNTSKDNKMSTTFKLQPLKLEQYTLDNGLRVVLNKDDSAPVVSVAVYYDVGSRNEREGRTGFAHLFEHMMFQGSENVKKAEHFQYVSNAGGTMNGTTSTERTNYFEALPANQLPLGLWLESDRMRSLAVTEENLTNQRNAVQEEKRLGENQPFGQVFDQLMPMIYKNFANSHSVIGSMADLDAATVKDVQDFFRINYAPNNAVLVISGAFEPNEAKELVKKYFATIPKQPKPPVIDVSEPKEVAVNYKEFEDKLAPFPAFILAWKIPQRRTAEYNALDLAGKIISGGESSRLYQKLVKGDESVLQLVSFTDERRGPSGFLIFAIPKPGKDLSKIRQVIMNEIKDMATKGPTAEEMQKLHNQLLNDTVRSRQSSLARAQNIAEYTLYDGDPTLINSELDELLKVTPAQIKDAVNKYLNTENRVLLDIVPAGKGKGATKEIKSDKK
ncbi:MAG: insulinase family protein [Acidobacteriota bacterium]|nr:insulinase family protein [Acidobacteriota bacterium]